MHEHNRYIDNSLKLIISKCYKLSTKTRASAFYHYSPHVQQLEVRIFTEGWKCDTDPDIIYQVYFDRNEKVEDELYSLRLKLDKLYKQLISNEEVQE